MQEQEGEERIVAKSEPTMNLVSLDVSTRRFVATEEDQEHLNFPEDSISTKKLVASGNSETEGKDEIWPHNLQKSEDGVPHMEKVFSIVRQRYGLSPRDEMKSLDCERSHVVYIYVCHSSSCSSSTFSLHGEIEIDREWTQETIETIVSSDSEADHWPDWNYKNYNEWLAAADVERYDSADWQSCSVFLQLPKPTPFLTQCYVWEVSVLNQSQSMGK